MLHNSEHIITMVSLDPTGVKKNNVEDIAGVHMVVSAC